MAKTLARGTTLTIESDEVGNLTSIAPPGPTKGEIPITDFDSTAVEYLMDLPDMGEMSFAGFFNYANTGQAAMLTDALDFDAPARDFTINMPGQGAFTFSGYVKSFVPSAGGVSDAVTFAGSIRVTGAVTFTEES